MCELWGLLIALGILIFSFSRWCKDRVSLCNGFERFYSPNTMWNFLFKSSFRSSASPRCLGCLLTTSQGCSEGILNFPIAIIPQTTRLWVTSLILSTHPPVTWLLCTFASSELLRLSGEQVRLWYPDTSRRIGCYTMLSTLILLNIYFLSWQLDSEIQEK